jgi:rhodanese-related sulfurtransferase
MRSWIAFTTAALLLAGLPACLDEPAPTREISPMETAGMLRNGFAVLVDGRERADLEREGMAQPAKSLPYSEVVAHATAWREFIRTLPRDKDIIIYSDSTARSQEIASALAKEGFKTGNMGAFSDWRALNLPTRQP